LYRQPETTNREDFKGQAGGSCGKLKPQCLDFASLSFFAFSPER